METGTSLNFLIQIGGITKKITKMYIFQIVINSYKQCRWKWTEIKKNVQIWKNNLKWPHLADDFLAEIHREEPPIWKNTEMQAEERGDERQWLRPTVFSQEHIFLAPMNTTPRRSCQKFNTALESCWRKWKDRHSGFFRSRTRANTWKLQGGKFLINRQIRYLLIRVVQ